MPVILATQEAETWRIKIQSQPKANNLQDPIPKWWNGQVVECLPSRHEGLSSSPSTDEKNKIYSDNYIPV
jgi:hypothetical protein